MLRHTEPHTLHANRRPKLLENRKAPVDAELSRKAFLPRNFMPHDEQDKFTLLDPRRRPETDGSSSLVSTIAQGAKALKSFLPAREPQSVCNQSENTTGQGNRKRKHAAHSTDQRSVSEREERATTDRKRNALLPSVPPRISRFNTICRSGEGGHAFTLFLLLPLC